MPDAVKVLGFGGALRKGSYNTAALHAVKAQGFPAPVQEFREKIRAADALLIVTPEYNYSMPGYLKNAIDWASRPPDQPFQDKAVGLISASMGILGGARAQYHLRQSLVF